MGRAGELGRSGGRTIADPETGEHALRVAAAIADPPEIDVAIAAGGASSPPARFQRRVFGAVGPLGDRAGAAAAPDITVHIQTPSDENSQDEQGALRVRWRALYAPPS